MRVSAIALALKLPSDSHSSLYHMRLTIWGFLLPRLRFWGWECFLAYSVDGMLSPTESLDTRLVSCTPNTGFGQSFKSG